MEYRYHLEMVNYTGLFSRIIFQCDCLLSFFKSFKTVTTVAIFGINCFENDIRRTIENYLFLFLTRFGFQTCSPMNECKHIRHHCSGSRNGLNHKYNSAIDFDFVWIFFKFFHVFTIYLNFAETKSIFNQVNCWDMVFIINLKNSNTFAVFVDAFCA